MNRTEVCPAYLFVASMALCWIFDQSIIVSIGPKHLPHVSHHQFSRLHLQLVVCLDWLIAMSNVYSEIRERKPLELFTWS